MINDSSPLLSLKQLGFSDARLAELAGVDDTDIRNAREAAGVTPIYKRVDTCAAEFATPTAYMYACYETPAYTADGRLETECEATPSDCEKVIILGGGPNRIGQGIEFDYCCVHAAYAMKEAGYETVMVNCNPETVSTDYDTSDRLYFEPLTPEDVLALCRKEQERGALKGVIVQFGGQTPLKLAHALEAAGIPIIGTPPDAIDLAEDRERFQQLLHTLNLRQPDNAIGHSREEILEQAAIIGFPLVVRPSYVLGGRAMEIIYGMHALEQYLNRLSSVFGDGPILLDRYLQGATEIDVDALSDGTEVFIGGIMEHIEEAGIHSGDSACALPPHSLSEPVISGIREQTEALALALGVKGLMNVQFAVKDDEIYIIEVNPRASRTVPFVSKTTGVPLAKLAARVMAGERLSDVFSRLPKPATDSSHVAVKEAVFPFARFPGVDVLLGPEMKSTGEAMGLDRDFPRAFAKSQLSSGTTLPTEGTVFLSVRDEDKPAAIRIAGLLREAGFRITATRGTAQALEGADIPVTAVNKVQEGRPHIVDAIKDGGIALVLNTTSGAQSIADSFSIRQTALLNRIPYSTTIAGSEALALAILALRKDPEGLGVRPLQEYFSQ